MHPSRPTTRFRRPILFAALLSGGLLFPHLSWGQSNTYWKDTATDGNWNNAANWTNGIPTFNGPLSSQKNAIFNAGPTNGPVINGIDVNARSIVVGYGETGVGIDSGVVTINGTGILRTDQTSYIGSGPFTGQSGVVNLNSGGKWISNNDIIVGHLFTGTLNINSGSSVSASSSTFGYMGGWAVNVDGTNSLLQLSQTLLVGQNNTGTLTITNGGTVRDLNATVGQNVACTVTIDSNGIWDNLEAVDLVHGTINLKSGVLKAGGGTGSVTVEDGTLRIGNGTSAGTVQAADVNGFANGPNAEPTILFKHSQTAYVFAPNVQNDLKVELQSGTTIFTGNVKSTSNDPNNLGIGAFVEGSSTMQIGNGGTAGQLNTNVSLDTDSNLKFNRSDAPTCDRNIFGFGSLWQIGSGTMTLTGTLDPALGDVWVTGSAPLVVSSNWDFHAFKKGSGTLILKGSTGSAFVPTVFSGTLQLGDGGTVRAVTYNAGGQVTVAGGATFALNRPDNFTFGAAILGNGTFRKMGTNELTLTHSFDYQGSTVIDGGKLIYTNTLDGVWNSPVSGAGTFVKDGTGQLALEFSLDQTGGTIIRNGLLLMQSGQINGAIEIEQSGRLRPRGFLSYPISGAGGILVTGDSVPPWLLGALSYSGTTTVQNGGNLSIATDLNNTLPGAFQIDAGGTLVVKPGANRLTLTGSIVNQGLLQVDGNLTIGDSSSAGSVTGGITVNVGGNLELYVESGAQIIQGNISGNGAVVKNGANGTLITKNSTISTPILTVNGPMEVQNGAITSGSVVLNSILYFYNNGSVSSTVTGAGAIRRYGPGTTVVTGSVNGTISGRIDEGILQIGNGGTAGAFSGDIRDDSGLTFNRANTYQHLGMIYGSGYVEQNGSGTVYLRGSNGYTGGTHFNAGRLVVDNPNSLGTPGSPLTFNGGTLVRESGTETYYQPTTLSAGGGTVEVQAGELVFAQPFAGTGNLTKTGAGALTLQGAQTYSGTTQVNAGSLAVDTGSLASASVAVSTGAFLGFRNATSSATSITGTGTLFREGTGTTVFTGTSVAGVPVDLRSGTLQIGNGGTAGSILGPINNKGTLTFNRSDSPAAFANAITGTGALIQAGTGTLTLSGANTYSGGTTISAGILAIGADSVLGTGPLTLAGGKLRNTAAFTSARSVTLGTGGGTFDTSGGFLTLTTPVGGAGGLTKTSGDYLTLQGNQTYTGATSIQGGTFVVRDGTLATASIALSSGTVIDFSGDGGYAGNITGSGGLSREFSGTTTLGGTNNFTGGVTVAGGTLAVNGTLSGSATTVQSGGTLGGTGSVAAVTIQSGGSLAPGLSPGTLSTGNLNLASGAHLKLELGGTGAGQFDRVNVTGTVTLAGDAQISLYGGFTPQIGNKFFVVVNDSTDAVSGTFSNDDALQQINLGSGVIVSVNYADNFGGSGTGNDVSLTVQAVPEPMAALLWAAAAPLLFSRRRRRA